MKKGADCLICTEKDAVKLPEYIKLSLPIYYMEMDLEVLEGKNHLDALIEKVYFQKSFC